MNCFKKKSLLNTLNRKGHELGRTMLEFLAVVAVIGFLMIGGLYTYNKAVTTTQVDRIHEDIMVLVSARYNRGTARTTKGIADVGSDDKTRLGNDISLVEECPSKGIFTVKIKDIKRKVCEGLYERLSQNTQFEIASYYRTDDWSKNCDTTNRKYIRSASECGDESVFAVSFSIVKNAQKPEVCKTDADCNYDGGTDNCRYCSSENICENKSGSGACGDGKTCHRGGRCHKDCNSNEWWNGTTCQTCPPHATCDSNIVSCEAGYEWNDPNCTECPNGTISAEGDNVCGPCDKGQKALPDHVSCTNCTATEDCGCGPNAKPDGEGSCTCDNGHSGENCACNTNVAKDGLCDASCFNPCMGGLVCSGNSGEQTCTCQRGLLGEVCYSDCGDNACVNGLTCIGGSCQCQTGLPQDSICNNSCPNSCASGLKCNGTCIPRTKGDECTSDDDCPTSSGLKCLGTENNKKCDCPSDKPNWDGHVCAACTCGENQYCGSNGQCQDCEAPTQSCTISENVIDETTGCTVTEAVTCTSGVQYCDTQRGLCVNCPTISSSSKSCKISQDEIYPADSSRPGCVKKQAFTCSGDTPICSYNGRSCVDACPSGYIASNGHCCSTRTSSAKYWNSETKSCGPCPTPSESCLVSQDVKDNDGVCVVQEAVTCSGETPLCNSDGLCVGACPEGTVESNRHCCPTETPVWSGNQCRTCTSNNECGEDQYCDVNGACQGCQTIASCLFTEDIVDETTGCFTQKVLVCSDNEGCNTEGQCEVCPSTSTLLAEDEDPGYRSQTRISGCYCPASAPYWDEVNGVCVIPNCSAIMQQAGFNPNDFSVYGNTITWNPSSLVDKSSMETTSDLNLTGCDLKINGSLKNSHSMRVNNLSINYIPYNSTLKEWAPRSTNLGTLHVFGNLTLSRANEYIFSNFLNNGTVTVDGNITSTNADFYNRNATLTVHGNVDLHPVTEGFDVLLNSIVTIDGYLKAESQCLPSINNVASSYVHGIRVSSSTLTVGGNITGTSVSKINGKNCASGIIVKGDGSVTSLRGDITGTGRFGISLGDGSSNDSGPGTIKAPFGSVTGTSNSSEYGIYSYLGSGANLIEAQGKVTGIAASKDTSKGIDAHSLTIKTKSDIEGTGGVGLLFQNSTIISCGDIYGSGYGGAGSGINIAAYNSNIQVKGSISGRISNGGSYASVHKIQIVQENEFNGGSIAEDASSDIGMGNVKARSFSSDYTFACIERNTSYQGYCSRYYTSNPTYTPEWCQ